VDQSRCCYYERLFGVGLKVTCTIYCLPSDNCLEKTAFSDGAAKQARLCDNEAKWCLLKAWDRALSRLDKQRGYSHISVCCAGNSEPEFEDEPETPVRPWLGMFALRSVPQPTWTNNISDYSLAYR
jgi:hypothetical protein